MTKTRSSEEEELLSTDISLEENAAKSKGPKAVKDNSEKQKDVSESKETQDSNKGFDGFGFSNALLKTLEEPPPHVVVILATTEPENVPATVLSRCLQFHLKNLTPVQLSKRLEHVLLEEKIKFDPESIDQIAKAGRGSLRDCLTITDQAIAFCNGDLVGSSVSEMLGTLSHDHVYELLDCIIEERAADLVEKLKLISTLSIACLLYTSPSPRDS